jgi:putative flippase GtrA
LNERQRVLGVLDHQVLRFAMVGVLNSVFGFGVFAGLQLTMGGRMHYLVILVIAHIVAVLEAYVLQRWLVFRVTGRWWRDLARFWSVYLGALAINLVALPLLVEIGQVSVLPAQAIVMLGTALATFVAHRHFTFRRPRDSSDQPVAGEIGRGLGLEPRS